MRIECESCGAAYAIDDAMITERGVRAQCPRCGHQKVVKSEGAAAPAPVAPPFGAAPAAPAGAPVVDPFGGGAPAAAPSVDPFGGGAPAAAPSVDPFGGGAPAAAPSVDPFGGGAPAAAPSVDPFGGGAPAAAPSVDPFGGGAPAAAPSVDPFGGGALAAAPSVDPFGGGAPAAAPSVDPFGGGGASPDPFAAAASGPSATDAGAGSAADLFGAVGLDSSSPAGGSAPDPFAAAAAAAGGAPAAAQDTMSAGVDSDGGLTWKIKLPDGEILEALSTDEVKEKIRSGDIDDKAEVALGEGAFIPIVEKKIFGPTLRITSGQLAPDRVHARGASVKVRSKAPLYLFLFIIITGAVLGGVVVFKPDWIEGLGGSTASNSFVRQAALWRLQFPDVDGTSEEHLRKGRKLYLEDTALGYRLADEEFRKALLLDPENIDAIAAFVENLARMPNLQQRTVDIRTAHDGLAFALDHEPGRHVLYRARGALLMATTDVQGAQEALDEARRLESFDAETLLLIAESEVERDSESAVELAKQAEKLDASLKRVAFVRGLAEASQGHYQAALTAFQKRLESDPEHVETLIALARLYATVGSFKEAVKSLEHVVELDGENRVARLLLGKLYYQMLGDLSNADLQLTVAADGLDGEEEQGGLAREILTHLAHVRARRGKWEEAQDYAVRALKFDSAFAPAHYILGRIKAHLGDHAAAQKHLGRVIQATGGTYLEAPARTALADTKIALALYAEAVRDYEKVTESDPRHARAYMGLAAAYAQLSDAPNMAMAMRRLIDLDPNIYETRVFFSDYPEDRKDLEIYLDAFRAFEGQPDDASIVQSSMAIVAYHLGDLRATDTHARAAIKDDPKNAAALLYLGASALQRRAPGRAVDALKRAHAANRLHHVTKYMLGSALLAAGQSEQAQTLLEDVFENKPNFLPAVVALADIARKRKEKDRARELYRQAFKADVDLLTAKRGLFLLGD